MLRIVDNSALLPVRITEWHVAFWKAVHRRHWHHWFAPGPYKHVSALGYSARCNAWVFYNPAGNGEHFDLLKNDESFVEQLEYVKARADLLVTCSIARARPIWRPGLYCVPQIIRLLGVRSCALTPGGLFRDLVRHGAKHSPL